MMNAKGLETKKQLKTSFVFAASLVVLYRYSRTPQQLCQLQGPHWLWEALTRSIHDYSSVHVRAEPLLRFLPMALGPSEEERNEHGTRDETLPNPRAVLAVIAVPSSCATFELVDHGSLGLLALGMLSDLRMLTVTYRCCCTFRFCFYTPPRVLDFTARPFHDSTTCNFFYPPKWVKGDVYSASNSSSSSSSCRRYSRSSSSSSSYRRRYWNGASSHCRFSLDILTALGNSPGRCIE
jgi:hypothetical protein